LKKNLNIQRCNLNLAGDNQGMITASTLLQHDRIAHGFFTRSPNRGKGLYRGLNCGLGSDDDKAAVTGNRAFAAAELGFPVENLTTLYQIHSADVAVVTDPWTADDAPKADAMVTATPGVMLGILTADCVPVLFSDNTARIVAAAHAGWKGALAGVIENTVGKMCELGAAPDNIRAAIGPAIQQKSYEVGPDFPAPFLARDDDNKPFFKPSLKPGHHLFDLTGFVAKCLKQASVGNIERTPYDTYGAPDLFYSYRRATHFNEPDYGRQLSAIGLKPD